MRGGSQKLRAFTAAQFHPAATLLHHLAALVVHGPAADALFVAHRAIRNARQGRRNGNEKQQDRNEAG
jgi:hypothetical protein